MWTEEMRTAFQVAKDALWSATGLAFPRPQAELALMVDVSAEHVGTALQQRTSPAAPWELLEFFSKKLDPAQVRYSAYNRELLACVQGIRHFRFMLEGMRFILYTDHKPLIFALSKGAELWTPRQCRHLSYVAEFTSDIRHIAGQDNVVADTLSWPPWRPPPRRWTTLPSPRPSVTAHPSRQPETPASPSSSSPSAPSRCCVTPRAATQLCT